MTKYPLRSFALGALVSLVCAPAASAAAPPARAAAPAASPTSIDIWVRAPGAYGRGADPTPQELRRVDLATLPQTEVQQQDVQFNAAVRFRGVPLQTVLAQHPMVKAKAAAFDTALLRFRNGMVVPLPLRDEAWLKRLKPFVALGSAPTKREWPQNAAIAPAIRPGVFTDVPHRAPTADVDYADVRPIKFVGNKLVVSDLGHPAVPARHAATFSPWSHVDSLAGIELVDGAAYARQFQPAPAAAQGAALFQESCQFCHGARKVGASFGWDFVEPIAIYTYRKTETKLYYHIRYRATERGQQMPALRHIDESEAGALLGWLRAVATEPMPAYTPAR